jgi:hypothetical protein
MSYAGLICSPRRRARSGLQRCLDYCRAASMPICRWSANPAGEKLSKQTLAPALRCRRRRPARTGSPHLQLPRPSQCPASSGSRQRCKDVWAWAQGAIGRFAADSARQATYCLAFSAVSPISSSAVPVALAIAGNADHRPHDAVAEPAYAGGSARAGG